MSNLDIVKDVTFYLLDDLRNAPRDAVLYAEKKYGDGDGQVKKEAAVDYVVNALASIAPDLPYVDEESAIRSTVGVAVEYWVDKLNAFLKPAE